MSQDARLDEEQATQRRARILGLDYIDTSQIDNKVLYRDVLTKDELYQLKTIPVRVDQSNILFGVTTTTSQQTMNALHARFQDQRVTFAIMSDVGYREYMKLYDPPAKVIYEDIDVNSADSSMRVDQV